MPELPEVETIRNALLRGTHEIPSLLGKTCSGSELFWERTLATPSPEIFQTKISGQVIHAIERRGKYLIFRLTDEFLLIHLRMSGDLFVEQSDAPIAKHHRLVLYLDDGFRLAFNDTRKFGRVWLVSNPEEILAPLGPEPLEENFTADDFYQRLHERKRQLKPLLMDQAFIAGLGNIYTDEALHRAQLHPLNRSNKLTETQAKDLWNAIREVLREGIRRNGASIDWVYRGGEFQNYFRVYDRADRPCPICSTPIHRIVVGQRGTHFCPTCQPAET